MQTSATGRQQLKRILRDKLHATTAHGRTRAFRCAHQSASSCGRYSPDSRPGGSPGSYLDAYLPDLALSFLEQPRQLPQQWAHTTLVGILRYRRLTRRRLWPG